MRKLHYITKNPLFIVVPLVAVLLLGWYTFVAAQPPLNSSQSNILPNAGFDDIDDSNMPIGWQFTSDRQGAAVKSEKGYGSSKLIALFDTSIDKKGSTTLTSPLATVKNQETYLYKGFYRSTMPFDLIMRTNEKDGSHTQAIVGHYVPSGQWATVSYVFTAGAQTQTVQFIYSVAQKGELQIDNNYLEPHPQDVYHAPQPTLTHTLASDLNPLATGWQTGPVPAEGNQILQARVTYRSKLPSEAVVDYTLRSGRHKYAVIGTLLPAAEWTTYTATFEAPPDTSAVALQLNAHGGIVEAKDMNLFAATHPDTQTWRRPLVSYTFDDGWEASYKNAAPLLEKNNFKGTFYVNPAALDTYDFMSSEDVDVLRSHGHELASHGYTHEDLTTLNGTSIDYQLRRAYQYFTDVHSEQSVNVAAPYGNTDAQVAYYAHRYYVSLRGTADGINTRQNLNRYDLLTFYVRKDTSLKDLRGALDEAKARHGWLILVYHRVDSGDKAIDAITPEQFQQELDVVKGSNIAVEPIKSALQEINNQ